LRRGGSDIERRGIEEMQESERMRARSAAEEMFSVTVYGRRSYLDRPTRISVYIFARLLHGRQDAALDELANRLHLSRRSGSVYRRDGRRSASLGVGNKPQVLDELRICSNSWMAFWSLAVASSGVHEAPSAHVVVRKIFGW
jgi:hypothetical protein